jgi:hypothetical protein
MKKLLLILLISPLMFLGQNNYVTFLDGETMKRDVFLDDCVESFKKQGKTSGFKNNGRDFCNCFLEKLAKNFSLLELGFDVISIKERSNNNSQAAALFLNNKKAEKVIYECMEDPNLFNNDKMEISSEEELRAIVSECKKNHKKGMTLAEYNEFLKYVYIDNYCECYMKRLFAEFTIEEMSNLEKNSSDLKKAERIQEMCIIEHAKE